MLIIDGRPCGDNYGQFMVIHDGEEKPLSLNSFRYIATMAVERKKTKGGWVLGDLLNYYPLFFKYIYRTRKESGIIIENKRGASQYRLVIPAKEIKINYRALKENPLDHRIRSLAGCKRVGKIIGGKISIDDEAVGS